MATTSSATTTTAVLAPAIPKVTLNFLNSDGTVSLAWYRFLQSLTGNQSTIVTNASATTTTINNITTTISGTTSIATEALDLAQSLEALNFLGASESGAMTGSLDLGPNGGPVDPFAFINQPIGNRPRQEPRPHSPTLDEMWARLNDLEAVVRPRNVPRPHSPDIMRLAVPTLDQPPVKVSTGTGLISNHLKSLTFGTGTTATSDVAGNVAVTASGGGGGGSLEILNGSTVLTTAATSLAFTGSGVTATASGTAVTATISGGGGGSGYILPFNPPAPSYFPNIFTPGGTAVSLTQDSVRGLIIQSNGMNGGAYTKFAAKAVSSPSSPWTLTAQIISNLLEQNYNSAAIILYDSVGGRTCTFGNLYASGTTLEIQTYAYPGGGYVATQISVPYQGLTWFKVVFDGTNLLFYVSADGSQYTYRLIYSAARSSIFANNVAYIGAGFLESFGTTENTFVSIPNWTDNA
jgi:hypothetical protein